MRNSNNEPAAMSREDVAAGSLYLTYDSFKHILHASRNGHGYCNNKPASEHKSFSNATFPTATGPIMKLQLIWIFPNS